MDASDVLARLPLPDAFCRVWREALPPDVLEPLDEEHRGASDQELNRDLTTRHRLLGAADLAPHLAAIEADTARTRDRRRETIRDLRARKPHRVKRPRSTRHLPENRIRELLHPQGHPRTPEGC